MERKRCGGEPRGSLRPFLAELRRSPITIETEAANEQHYEVPARFFDLVLGPRLKYSSGYWPGSSTTLPESEEAMMDLFCRRADVTDGMEILELGCGWGSLALWIAQKYPGCRILAVSNSRTQRELIGQRCRSLGLQNVEIQTADIGHFSTDRTFDRVLSVEMFEHVRNYEALLGRISRWLKPDGLLMVHIFCHACYAYPFETEGAANWMGRRFFTGGIMPSDDLLAYFQADLVLCDQWRFSGMHYARTLEAWLENCDRNRSELLRLFEAEGQGFRAKRELERWRIFFMACAELFRYRGGREWYVSHYRFEPRPGVHPG
ncbi:MAG: class I SAM-dependent methyltransferase [Acidobacteria bacterium]|nr:class I SAM-dependent methyltransferase [Acidobacteriota bacterium]